MKHLLLVSTALFSLFGSAQTPFQCGSSHPTSEAIKQTKRMVANAPKSGELRIIPVVFHVLHQYGSENISDAQILDQMEILNEDFQRMNADTSMVQAPFDTIIGKVNFEFRLAHLNPWGNPTTGIDRIATPLTNVGDESAMINMWDPAHYVNIWVVNNTLPGLSGFSINPLVSQNPCATGIMMLNDYIGSIGTASPASSFGLTHEMGHYFGLFHTFGDNPNFQCGPSDGIYDTPYTNGNSLCNFAQNSCNDSLYSDSFDYWGFDPRSNVENFMDYTWCNFMFTNGQATMMRAVQENPLYGRDQLSTEANLIATGTGPGTQTASTALPNSSFIPGSRFICAGWWVEMINGTGMTAGDTYSWSFPGGTPATSTEFEPTVTYNDPGFHQISLTVTNANGSAVYAISPAVYVSPNGYDFYGPTVQDFDVDNEFWIHKNYLYDTPEFARVEQNGVNGSGCYLLNNQLITDSSMLCSPFTYQDNLTGKVDELISPAFGLNYTTNVVVSFDYAYASSETDLADMTEKLKIYSSRDCGATWFQRKLLSDTALTTAFENIGTAFVPTANQWKHASFNYTTTSTDYKTRFKFQFTGENHSNYLYIDNFRIDGILGIEDESVEMIELFPNPVQKGGALHFTSTEQGDEFELQIMDLQGKVIFENEHHTAAEFQLPEVMSAGMYLVKINNITQRLVVE